MVYANDAIVKGNMAYFEEELVRGLVVGIEAEAKRIDHYRDSADVEGLRLVITDGGGRDITSKVRERYPKEYELFESKAIERLIYENDC